MLSRSLSYLASSSRARRLVEGTSLTRRVVDRFVAGEDQAAAVRCAVELKGESRFVTIDVLGEDVTDQDGARATADSYVQLLKALQEAGCARGTDVSLKLSALGQALSVDGDAIATSHAWEICAAADALGATVTLDMEDHTTVESTLLIGERLRADFPSTANVLQSNLLRTPGDIADLAGAGVRLRLVKGAYREPKAVAHQRKADVDLAYAAGIEAVMASRCYPMVATHDPAMLRLAAEKAAQHGRSPDSWEVQMLLGVRTDLQARVASGGAQVRIYVPYGQDWYGYFMRRLAERPANVAFFLRALVSR